jgi:RNase H-like domain found in reverse transcriptase
LLLIFSGHIDRLAEMAAPLCEVLVGTAWNKPKKKKEQIRVPDWEARCQREQEKYFWRLWNVLADPSFLVPSRPGVEKRLCTDASRYGLGVALLQFEGDGKGWLPVGFAS